MIPVCAECGQEHLPNCREQRVKSSFYYPLFSHMASNHDLILLDSEMEDILQVCGRIQKATKVGTLALIFNAASDILLGRKGRSCAPELVGKWVTPGGRLNYGESLWEGCRRECAEEIGVVVRQRNPLPPMEWLHKDWHFVFSVFDCCVEGRPDMVKAGDDLTEVAWFKREEIPWDDLTPLTSQLLRREGLCAFKQNQPKEKL